MTAVYLCETNPPEDEDPLNWMLLTSLPVDSIDGALTIAKWYGMRWEIEHFHKVLKSGCRVESDQLRDADNLTRLLALKSILAWKIHAIARADQEKLSRSCESTFQTHEWQAAYCILNKSSAPPKEPPTLGEMRLWVAKLGGFLARKSDGKPGMISIWRGMRKLASISEAYLIFNSS